MLRAMIFSSCSRCRFGPVLRWIAAFLFCLGASALAADCVNPPLNDNLANARALTNDPGTVLGLNSCATKELDEPDHAGNVGGHSVWYRWTATHSGSIRLSTEGSDFDTLLAVYLGGDYAHLSLIASNDDILTPDYPQSRLTFIATAGLNYYIAVDGFNGAVGRIVLNLDPPRNDAFASCQTIAGTTGSVTGLQYRRVKGTWRTSPCRGSWRALSLVLLDSPVRWTGGIQHSWQHF